MLVERTADGIGQLRRVGIDSAAGQLAVAPAPAAVVPIVTSGRRVSTGVEGGGRLGGGRW